MKSLGDILVVNQKNQEFSTISFPRIIFLKVSKVLIVFIKKNNLFPTLKPSHNVKIILRLNKPFKKYSFACKSLMYKNSVKQTIYETNNVQLLYFLFYLTQVFYLLFHIKCLYSFFIYLYLLVWFSLNQPKIWQVVFGRFCPCFQVFY